MSAPEAQLGHLLLAKNAADNLGHNLNAAFWVNDNNANRANYLVETAHGDFARIAEILGYEITRKKPEATQ